MKIFSLKVLLIGLTVSFSGSIFAQKEALRQKIEKITLTSKGKVGVAVLNLDNKDTLTFNGFSHMPMQSTYKFPLALAILDQVDKGRFTLNQKIYITKKDMLPNTMSPLTEKYPNGNVDIKLSELLQYTVGKSDNNGCDILFRLIGGPVKVNNFIHSLGVKGISIVATEEQMHKNWNTQFTNWCEPYAMTQLLEVFYQGEHLSKSSNTFLKKLMTETTTGLKRIKGLLPEGTIVINKKGTSDTNDKGITAATNDAGIVTLPDGKHFAIVVFVTNSPENQNNREKVIAEITKAVWDYYITKH